MEVNLLQCLERGQMAEPADLKRSNQHFVQSFSPQAAIRPDVRLVQARPTRMELVVE